MKSIALNGLLGLSLLVVFVLATLSATPGPGSNWARAQDAEVEGLVGGACHAFKVIKCGLDDDCVVRSCLVPWTNNEGNWKASSEFHCTHCGSPSGVTSVQLSPPLRVM